MALSSLVYLVGLLLTSVTATTDEPCISIGGVCKDDRQPCAGGYLTGKCSGGVHNRCCHKDGKCLAIQGKCQDDHLSCPGGYVTGLCSGGTHNRCCKPAAETSGLVSSKCMRCICMVESGCKSIGCVMDVGSLSCGPFQIKEAYWQDCGSPGGGYEACAKDYTCSYNCVQKYMARYINSSGCPRNCESYARLHNGGPRGCKSSSTLSYWTKIMSKGCTTGS